MSLELFPRVHPRWQRPGGSVACYENRVNQQSRVTVPPDSPVPRSRPTAPLIIMPGRSAKWGQDVLLLHPLTAG